MAKIVGTGSYQEISVHVRRMIEGREQHRGVCQGCARDVAVMDGLVALHGYDRPGNGWIVGRCPGSGKVPANTSISFTRETIKGLRDFAAGCWEDANSYEEQARAVVIPEYDQADPEPWRAARRERAEFEKRQRDSEYMARRNEDYAQHLINNALPAKGTPLRVVVVTD